MKHLIILVFSLTSFLSFGQFNCIDGEVWSCNGFVDDANIYGNLDFSDNSITSYTCDGATIGFSLGTGLNDLYGQDDIYIFNSIGESGALNSMTVTLTMDADTDLDMIAISPDCSYNCFASDSYTFSGTGVTETFTLEWEDEQTIILIVEAYHLDGGGDYQLNFQYNNLYNFCSYFPYEGTPITCSPSNQYSGSLFPVNCITSFPTDCPPEITYHEGEGPYFANEHVYTFIPEANGGVINIDLSLSSGMKAYLYHKYSVGIDLTPINLIGLGSSFISASYTLNGFDEFYLIIDGPDQGVYPYSFSVDFPGCSPIDECGDCFSYTEIGNGKCKIDNSLTPTCGNEEWTYTSWPNGGNNTSFTLNSNNEVQFPIAGDYLVCYTHYCDDLPTLALNNNESQIGKTCCIVVSIGESCSEPPVAHFTGSPNVQNSTGHINFFNSNSSLNADSYSWHWGDGNTNTTSQTNISHDYAIEPNPVNLCMVASNECGMSKYCISYDTYGDGFSQFDCGLPFSPYSPPPIYPFVDGNTVSISDLSFACGAQEITFDPGDGSGEYAISCNGASYTYPDDEPYICCVRVRFSCFTICFCYTVRPGGFDCNNDPWVLECNTSGDLTWTDSTNPNNHNGLSTLSDIVDNHNGCVSTIDGWDDDNTLAPNVPFGRREVIYEIINPSDNHLGDITIDLIMLQSNQDLDVFVYGSCNGNGDFSNCVASSTHNNIDPINKRDAVLLTGVPAFEKYYVVVDGQSNAPTTNEGNFQISYTCGSICKKDAEGIQCGQTISGSTINETNEASYYCNCENESVLGPGGNFGPEKKYRLDIQQTSNVTISLDITTPNVDLELYLLNECSSSFCNTNSRNSVNESEIIQKTLSAGTYYIVVEGFAGDKGDFQLSVSGCEIQPVPSSNCELVSSYNFENYNDGDLIPTDDNSGLWEYGINYSDDPNDDSLDATIEESSSKKMVLNAGNYSFSDVRLNYEDAKEGIRKIEWDHTFQYVDGDLYGGTVQLFEETPLLDFSQQLEVKYGYDSNGNYAELFYKSFGFVGVQSTKLANILTIENYNGTNVTPSFKLEFAYDLDNGQFTFSVDNQPIYTGYFAFETSFLLENRAINFSVDDNQDYMEIDNIRVSTCEDCSVIYDDDCDNIFLTGLDEGNNGNISVTLDQSGISESSIQGYQVIDEVSGDITDLNSLDYSGCIPGRSYKFCILYLDEDECLKACCYRITIPLNCQYWLPYYSGNDDNISYTYQSDNLPSGYDVQQWFVDGTFAGGSNSISQSYSGAQSSFVCCVIYDPFAKQYTICCRKVCAEIATDCNNVTVSYDPTSETYELGVTGAAEVLSWNIDIPSNLPNNGEITDPTLFKPSDFGISPGQTILVSVKYIDNTGCVKVCCKEIEIPIPQDAVIIDIEEVCGAVGSIVTIPVKLYNFENIGSVGFEIISGDPSKVRLESIVNVANEFSSLAYNAVNNKIILGWDDPQGVTKSVTNGTRMFDIEVTILTDFSSAVIVFGSQVEVLGTNLIDASVIQGSICVDEAISISGIIRNESNERMEEFDVRLYDDNFAATVTNQNGEYLFNNVAGQTVEVEAYNNDNIKQGVTNADVALIRRHFLQISNLDTDYKMLAGDINKNGSITNADVALARRIFLEVITDEIPNNTSWRFVPESADISVNPLDINLEDRIILSGISGPTNDANFVAVKIGDVNNSVNIKHNQVASSRAASLMFIIDDISVVQGSTISIPLRVTDFDNIALFGFEMSWDNTMLNLTDIQPINLEGFSSQNYNIQDGKVILGWDEPNGSAIDFADGPILNFTFEVGDMSMGTTSLNFTAAEILDADFAEVEHVFDSGDIVIETTGFEEVEDIGVRVWPNPFSQNVSIELGNIKYGLFQLSVTSIDGKIIWSGDQSNFQDGKLILGNEEIPLPGVYMVTVISGKYIYSYKIVKI